MSASHIHGLGRKKKIDYSNYHFVLALYAIYKYESKKEARLPVNDFRNGVFQKQSSSPSLKQRLGRYIMAIRKAIMFSTQKRNQQLLTNGLESAT